MRAKKKPLGRPRNQGLEDGDRAGYATLGAAEEANVGRADCVQTLQHVIDVPVKSEQQVAVQTALILLSSQRC